MWYEKSFRRHLCDMHIDDWDSEYMSKFSPEEYYENLKRENVQSVMIPLQSHTGLCHYPTKTGKMHNSFIGKEDAMKRFIDLCHEGGISVVAYYSVTYNNWAHDNHPDWRMLTTRGTSMFGDVSAEHGVFASNPIFRYGICCPNNMDYREFTKKQIHEMVEYADLDCLFYDMLFWVHPCYCDKCKERFLKETGHEIPMKEDYQNPVWKLFEEKRREWMGEFAQLITDETKAAKPDISVYHNFATAVINRNKGNAEGVNKACDFVGGDLYGNMYSHSFVCKFYRNITNNQPFEYMFSRCDPNLSTHTSIKSDDRIRSAIFTTAAHHGATMVIDAINVDGTMDSRVFDRMGKLLAEQIPYEKYFTGDMIEDVGVYYSLRSKFNAHGFGYNTQTCSENATENLIAHNISCGVTGGWHDISQYKILSASCLTEEDKYDYNRIIDYVKNGGKLYISGGDCHGLLKEFFGAEVERFTDESVVYISPTEKCGDTFEWFNEFSPMPYECTAPVLKGFRKEDVIATLNLPHTIRETEKFAAIHSNPPGHNTDIPALLLTNYGKGKVLWMGLPIEDLRVAEQYRRIYTKLLTNLLGYEPTVKTTAPIDVEVVAFKDGDDYTVSSVLLNDRDYARFVEPFTVSIKTDKKPAKLLQLPEEKEIPFTYEDGYLTYDVPGLKMFDMKKIITE